MLLYETLCSRIGRDNVVTGHTLDSFSQDASGVTAQFVDRATGAKLDSARGDVLIGADGIHSTVRRHLHPGEGEPRFAQQVMWRSAVDAEAFLGGGTMIIAGHFHQRIIAYPMGSASKPGHLLTNWVCQMTVPDGIPLREDWNRRVSKDKVLAAFGTWRFPWLDMAALIERTSDIYEFPLVDRDPVETWTSGRVTLIGDAAHPMQPIGSQAGSQAIVDARVLTAALLASADPIEALLRYDAQRRPVMNDITLRNRCFGPEAAMQLVEERAPNGFAGISDVISQDELDRIASSFSTAAGLDVETVNSRPAYVRSMHGGASG
jgi:2-polyprenyl-6-methoxyphenol hydroxylase-like FAD-dependent oxidoreductase